MGGIEYKMDLANGNLWAIHYFYERKIEQVKNPKQRVQLKQDLDKYDHFIRKINQVMDDINSYFRAFGGDDDATEN